MPASGRPAPGAAASTPAGAFARAATEPGAGALPSGAQVIEHLQSPSQQPVTDVRPTEATDRSSEPHVGGASALAERLAGTISRLPSRGEVAPTPRLAPTSRRATAAASETAGPQATAASTSRPQSGVSDPTTAQPPLPTAKAAVRQPSHAGPQTQGAQQPAVDSAPAAPPRSPGREPAPAQANQAPAHVRPAHDATPTRPVTPTSDARTGHAIGHATAARPSTQTTAGSASSMQPPGAPVPVEDESSATPAAATAPEAGPLLDRGVALQEMIESIGATVEIASRQGIARARIALAPAELGEIRIHLSQTSAGLLARVTAQTPAAAQALAGGRSELHHALSSLGASLLRLDIGASTHGDLGRRPQASPTPARQTSASAPSRDGVAPPAAAASGGAPEHLLIPSPGALVDVLA